jgi:hypothetical protein
MQYWTKDIIIDPSDATQKTWYVCVFSGWGGAPNGKGGLFKTTNRGASWTKLTGSQFDRVTSITFNPLQLTQAYLTTETQGLWVSGNMNVATPTWSLVSNYEFRQPERVFFNPFNPSEMWVTSFGNGLKVGSTTGTVPTRIISFNGHRERSLSKLQWNTSNEDAGDVYEVERSLDGINFLKIASVTGDVSYHNQYYYEDVVAGSALYYRIKIRTVAGNAIYSNIIFLKTGAETIRTVQLMENPVTGNIIHLQTAFEQAGKLSLIINDATGNIVLRQMVDVNTGVTQLSVPVPAGCVNGMYVLQVSGMGIKKNIRMLLIK